MIKYDKIASDYARHRKVHPKVLKSLITVGRLRKYIRVLEVGCGTGNYIGALHRLTGCAGLGTDPSRKMLSEGRKKQAGIEFKTGKAGKLDFRGGSFGLVFSVDVIHHVDDINEYFGEAFRVLDDKGRFCTVTDSESMIRRREPLSRYFPETVRSELKRYPKVSALRKALKHAGFRDIREISVELPYIITDIAPYRDKAFSALHIITAKAFRKGINRMESDLLKGPVKGVSRYLLLWGTKKQPHDNKNG